MRVGEDRSPERGEKVGKSVAWGKTVAPVKMMVSECCAFGRGNENF